MQILREITRVIEQGVMPRIHYLSAVIAEMHGLAPDWLRIGALLAVQGALLAPSGRRCRRRNLGRCYLLAHSTTRRGAGARI